MKRPPVRQQRIVRLPVARIKDPWDIRHERILWSEPLNLFLQQILTPEGGDQHISILDQLFYEFICPLQLDFVACDALSEIRTVQERVGELQRREPHGPRGFLSHFWLFWKSFGAYSHRCSAILSSDHLCKLLRLLHFLTSARVLGFGTLDKSSGGVTPAG